MARPAPEYRCISRTANAKAYCKVIFAELQYDQHYSELHAPLVEILGASIQNMEHGLQGDSWIWISENDEKVAIDTLSSMKHQVKSDASCKELVARVIESLSTRFQVHVFAVPEIEPHEET